MKGEISWTKGAFSNTYKLRGYEGHGGELKLNSFNSHAKGSIGGKQYAFRAKGCLSKTIDMICQETNTIIAKIRMGNWRMMAKIDTGKHQYTWRYKNLWQTRWSVFDEQREYVTGKSNGFMTSGDIEFRPSSEEMVLAGLFIKDYYVKMSAVV